MKFFLIYGLFMMGLLSPTEWLRYNRQNASSDTTKAECLLRPTKAGKQAGNRCQVLLVVGTSKHTHVSGCIAGSQIELHSPTASVPIVALKPADRHSTIGLPWKICILLAD